MYGMSPTHDQGMMPQSPQVGGPVLLSFREYKPGNHQWVAERDCTVVAYAIGAGAERNGFNGGGGGGACRKRIAVKKGQRIDIVVASASGTRPPPTYVYFPDGTSMMVESPNSNIGGYGVGGDLNRRGGNGGLSNGTRGGDGEFGGQGRPFSHTSGGGGGAAGFSDEALGILGGDGAYANQGASNPPSQFAQVPGGGGAGSSTETGALFGADARVYLAVFTR